MEISLGILFAFYLKDDKGLSFDEYVDKYKSDDKFKEEVNSQEDVNKYRIVKEDKL